jgi:hypothetical protein
MGGRRGLQKPRPGLTGDHARQVAALAPLRDLLNGGKGAVADEIRALVEGTIAAGLPGPTIPPGVSPRYRTLAHRYPFVHSTTPPGGSTNPALDGATLPMVRAANVAPGRTAHQLAEFGRDAVQVAEFAAYLGNPHRDRLRQCEHCRIWFLDVTRNASARRCTRACTRKWEVAQRRNHGATNGGPGGRSLPGRRPETAAVPVRQRA